MVRRWLAKIRGILAYLLIIGIIAAGSLFIPFLQRASLELFQPLDLVIEPPQSLLAGNLNSLSNSASGTSSNGAPSNSTNRLPGTTQPLTNRVVLVVIAGFSFEDVAALPVLNGETFRQTSINAHLFTSPVQPATPGLLPILTGASVDLTGGFSLDSKAPFGDAVTPANQLQRLETFGACGNLLSCTRHNKNTTAFFGTNSWEEAFKPEWLDYFETFPDDQPAVDISNAALNFLKKKSANFSLIQFTALNQVVSSYGYNSKEASAARQDLDEALSQLLNPKEIELNRTTVIITGDWDTRVRAGDRWTVPLMMTGQAIQPGETFWGRQEDISSTVAALLGVEIPRINQGRTLNGALAMPSIDLAEKMLALVEQRRALAQAYRLRLGLSLPLAINDPLAVDAEKSLRVAIQDYRLGSYDNVESVLDPVLRHTRQDMAQAREEWFNQDQGQRSIISLGVVLIPLLSLLLWRTGLNLLAFLAAFVASGLPYFFYLGQSPQFTFSSVSPDNLRDDSLWRAGLSILAGLLIPALFFDWAERRQHRVTGRVHLSFILISGLRVPAFPFRRLFGCCFIMLGWLFYFNAIIIPAWYYWRFGVPQLAGNSNTPVLPDFNAVFQVFFTLDHLLGFALWMALAPVLLSGLFALKRRLVGDGEKNLETENTPVPPSGSIIIKA